MYKYLKKPYVWIVTSVFLFSINDFFMKLITNDFSVSSIIFFRSLFSLLFLFLFLRPTKFTQSFKTKNLHIHVARGIVGFVYLFCAIFSLRKVELSLFSCILFASPIIIVILSSLFFGERFSWKALTSCLISFLGVMIVLSPGNFEANFYILIALVAAGAHSITILLAKRASKQDSHETLIMYYIVFALISSYLTGDVFAEISNKLVLIAGMSGLIHLMAFSSFIKALKLSSPSILAPYEYLGLIFSFSLGGIWFGEFLSPMVLLGVAIVLIGSVCNMTSSQPLKRNPLE